MAASTVAPLVVELVAGSLATFAALAGTGGKITGGWGMRSRATLPSSVTRMLPSGPATIPLGLDSAVIPSVNSVTTPSGVI